MRLRLSLMAAIAIAVVSVNIAGAATLSTPVTIPGLLNSGPVVVDDANHQVFVSDGVAHVAAISDTGAVLHTFDLSSPDSMVLDAAAHTLYVDDASATSIHQIDTQTLALGSDLNLTAAEPAHRRLVLAGSTIWYAYDNDASAVGIGSYAPATTTSAEFPGNDFTDIAADPADPDTIFSVAGFPEAIHRWDIASGAPVAVANSTDPVLGGDVSVSPDGARVYVSGSAALQEFDATSLALEPATFDVPTDFQVGRAVVSPDGARVYAAAHDFTDSRILAYDRDGTRAADWTLSVTDFGLSDDGGSLYVSSWLSSPAGNSQFEVLSDATQLAGTISLDAATVKVAPGAGLALGGRLVITGVPAAAGTAIDVVRSTSHGSITDMGEVTTDATGAFSYTATAPTTPDAYRYSFTYAGASDITGGEAAETVDVPAKTALTLTAAATSAHFHAVVNYTAHLTGTSAGGTVAGRSVTLSDTANGITTTIATKTVGAGGLVTFPVQVAATSKLAASFAGNALFDASTSPSKAISVRVGLTTTLSANHFKRSGRYWLYHHSAKCTARSATGCPVYSVTSLPLVINRQLEIEVQVLRGGKFGATRIVRADQKTKTLKLWFDLSKGTSSGYPTRVRVIFKTDRYNTAYTTPWSYLQIVQ
jgi:hypothetical protein